MKLEEFVESFNDTYPQQEMIIERFKDLTDCYPKLKELRDWVETKIFGFGCRSFLYMHKMIIESFEQKELKALEIGVFRGQILSSWGIIEELCDKSIDIYGITPLDTTDGHWESDYEADIKLIHDTFGLRHPNIIKGNSTDPEVIESWNLMKISLDLLYIDGGHTYDVVISDINNYSKSVRKGGYMVIDDSANNMKCCGGNYFWGIQSVSDATDSILPPITENNDWLYIGNVMHNRIWKRL